MITKEAARYDRFLWFLEVLAFRNLRRRLLSGVSEDILEIGIGTGANLPFYPESAIVTAIDPRPGLLHGIQGKSSIETRICCADAIHLPFGDNSFQTIVSTLVFCSVTDVPAGLQEVWRLLKPGGKLLMLEHVRGRTPFTRRLTDLFNPAWYAMQKECNLNRETEESVREAGFTIHRSSLHGHGMLLLLDARKE